MRIRGESVLMRLMLLFLMLVLPIFVLSLLLYEGGLEQLDGQMAHSLEQQLDFVLEQMNGQIVRAQEDVARLLRDGEMNRLAVASGLMTPFERARQINAAQEQLHRMRQSNALVGHAALYLPKEGLLLQSNAIDFMGYGNLHSDSTVREIQVEDYEAALQDALCCNAMTAYVDGRLLYGSISPHPALVSKDSTPHMIFLMEYSLTGLHRYLSRILPDMRVSFAMRMDSGEIVMTNLRGGTLGDVIAGFSGEGVAHLDVDGQTYLVLGKHSDLCGASLILSLSRDEALAPLRAYRNWIWVLCALFMLALIVYGLYAYRYVHLPIRRLVDGFQRLERGVTDFQIESAGLSEFSYLSVRFNQMLVRLNETIDALYRQRLMMQQAQLKQLQAQINPHFLYNSFYILDNMLALEEYEDASSVARMLGKYFRYITRDGRNMVPLDEELEHARVYTQIQRVRFGKRMTLTFDELPEDWERPDVPRLIIQPILENAFMHALDDMPSGGELCVRLHRDEACIQIEIQNNGVIAPEKLSALQRALEAEWTNERTGLINVHQRLLLTHGAGLALEPVEGGGLRVIVRIRRGGPLNESTRNGT